MIPWRYTIKDTGKRIFASSRCSKYILFFHNSSSSSRTSSPKMLTKPKNPMNSYLIPYTAASTTVQSRKNNEKYLCAVAREPQTLLGTTVSISTILINFLMRKKIDFAKFSFFITFEVIFTLTLH